MNINNLNELIHLNPDKHFYIKCCNLFENSRAVVTFLEKNQINQNNNITSEEQGNFFVIDIYGPRHQLLNRQKMFKWETCLSHTPRSEAAPE